MLGLKGKPVGELALFDGDGGDAARHGEQFAKRFIFPRLGGMEHRYHALWPLYDLDPQRAVDLLTATIEAFPKTPDREYRDCPERNFTALVMRTDDASGCWSVRPH